MKIWAQDPTDSTFKVIHTLSGHTDDVISVAFFLSDTQLVSGSFDKTAKVWSKTDDNWILKHTIKMECSVMVVKNNIPQGQLIIAGNDTKIHIYS